MIVYPKGRSFTNGLSMAKAVGNKLLSSPIPKVTQALDDPSGPLLMLATHCVGHLSGTGRSRYQWKPQTYDLVEAETAVS